MPMACIDRISPIQLSAVRVRVTASAATPLIRKLVVFDTRVPAAAAP